MDIMLITVIVFTLIGAIAIYCIWVIFNFVPRFEKIKVTFIYMTYLFFLMLLATLPEGIIPKWSVYCLLGITWIAIILLSLGIILVCQAEVRERFHIQE